MNTADVTTLYPGHHVVFHRPRVDPAPGKSDVAASRCRRPRADELHEARGGAPATLKPRPQPMPEPIRMQGQPPGAPPQHGAWR